MRLTDERVGRADPCAGQVLVEEAHVPAGTGQEGVDVALAEPLPQTLGPQVADQRRVIADALGEGTRFRADRRRFLQAPETDEVPGHGPEPVSRPPQVTGLTGQRRSRLSVG